VIHFLELFHSIFRLNNLTLVLNITTVYQDYLQVTFLLHADRCSRKPNEMYKNYIKWICLLLVVLNFLCWLNDSFFLYQFPTLRLQEAIYDSLVLDYRIIADILMPISVYYRFVCTLAFYAISQKLS